MRVNRSFLLIVCAMVMALNCGCTDDNPGGRKTAPRAHKLAAAHILIMHKYSPGRPPNVTRTQIEALELAQEVAKKAQAAGADFAALAKEYSDDPTGPEGGDLGVIQPTSVVPQFRDATRALEIGAVSDPVRTHFGYHIILRKEP